MGAEAICDTTYLFPFLKNIFNMKFLHENQSVKYFLCIDKTSDNYGRIMKMLSKEEASIYEPGDIVGGILKVVPGSIAAIGLSGERILQ